MIAQAYQDACSIDEPKLGVDSQPGHMLFIREMSRYQGMVCQFYQRMSNIPPVTDEAMKSYLRNLSNYNRGQCHVTAALREISRYICQFQQEVNRVTLLIKNPL